MCRTKALSRLLLPTHQLKLQLLLRVKNTSLLLTACSCRTSHDIRISYNRNFFPIYSQHITRTSSKATRVATFRNLKPFQAVFTQQRFWQKCISIVFPVRLFLTYLHDLASSPGSLHGFTGNTGGGAARKRAWYEPFAHARIIPGMSGIGY